MNYNLIVLVNKGTKRENLMKEVEAMLSKYNAANYKDDLDNPLRKYSKYQLYKGIPIKNGDTDVDICRLKDIDMNVNAPLENEAEEMWDYVVNNKESSYSNHDWKYLKRKYFLQKYGTKEHFVECNTSFYTFALVSPYGNWFDEGNTKNSYEWLKTFQSMIETQLEDTWAVCLSCML